MVKRRSNRNRLEIYAEILGYVKNNPSARKTHILYASNMNSRSFEQVFRRLVDIGALHGETDDTGATYYSITRLGENMLDEIEELLSILSGRRAGDGRDIEAIVADNCDEDICKKVMRGSLTKKVIRGISGQEYRVDTFGGDVLVVVISEEFFERQLRASIARVIIFLLDTDMAIILIAPARYRGRIESYLEKLGERSSEVKDLMDKRVLMVYFN